MRHDVSHWSARRSVVSSLHQCINMSSTHRDHLACEDHLYRSLRVAMEDPACAVDLDPSRVHCSLDSPLDPLSWIDETGERCSIVFPAFFDLYGDHTALEPYFSLLKDCTDLVRLSFCSSTSTSFDDFRFFRDFLREIWQKLMRPFNCRHCRTSRRTSTFHHMQLNVLT